MKEVLSQKNLEHLYIDISEGMLNLKKFLKYRDSKEEFVAIKEAGRVGLPCVVVNNGEELLFDEKSIQEILTQL